MSKDVALIVEGNKFIPIPTKTLNIKVVSRTKSCHHDMKRYPAISEDEEF